MSIGFQTPHLVIELNYCSSSSFNPGSETVSVLLDGYVRK